MPCTILCVKTGRRRHKLEGFHEVKKLWEEIGALRLLIKVNNNTMHFFGAWRHFIMVNNVGFIFGALRIQLRLITNHLSVGLRQTIKIDNEASFLALANQGM